MASDSRVGGSEDARTPEADDSPATGPDAGNTAQEPNAQVARPTAPSKEGQPRKRQSPAKESTRRSAERQAGVAGKQTVKKPQEKAAPVASPVVTGTSDKAQPPSGESDTSAGDQAAQEQSGGGSFWEQLSGNQFFLFNAVPSWVVSMSIHVMLLIVLALLTVPPRPPEQRIVAVANPNDVQEIENLENEEIDVVDVEVFEGQAPAELADTRTTTAELDIPSLDDMSAAPEQIKLEGFGEMTAAVEALVDRVGGGMGSGLGEVRGVKARRAMVEKFGGSKGSEAAVAAALKWLANHQLPDGGWHFDHTAGPCRGQCSHPGTIPPSRNGATAMALLPFLGAGQTHQEGKYKKTVENGLAYLIRSMKLGNGMGDLSDGGGRMYSHGLASIVLCEAYAMTNDPGLLQPAQLALNFIVYAQDPIGGGWRYKPHQAGDTSVLGWQLMALKSGHMGYLKVPKKTILGASKFLDFVQEDNGSKYGYTVPAQGPGTTAVGLLCRMYLGWKRDNASLKAGVEYLNQMGPRDNLYFNYYATQVMRHYGGESWKTWNSRMRDRMVDSQDKTGHALGSWFFQRDPHGGRGGRLYCTSMATMILEVYYRHMPIYGKQASEDEFPL